MPTLALLYPSVALQTAVDRLAPSLEIGEGRPAPAEAVRRQAAGVIQALLRDTGLWPRTGEGPPGQRWYWAAPAILDRAHLQGRRRWLSSAGGWRGDLAERDEAKGLEPGDTDLAHVAARVASGFRTLFNLPETITLLRGSEPEAYWRAVLHHGVDGDLQAVLDEYLNQLRDGLGPADHADEVAVRQVGEQMAEALSLRTAPVHADEIRVSGQAKVRLERLRIRFALRFADLRDDPEGTLARAGTVQEAFNSPFRTFVLTTTSIGQEGLDFHRYCHGVYHWNLPSNPVEMEQREGRVQRYKGHAVRKNVARRWGLEALRERMDGAGDPWGVLFEAAAADRPPGGNELIPYWIYEVPGGAVVERRVPMFSLSREAGRLGALQRGIAVYRLAFGQPRQEDLLAFLVGGEGGTGADADGVDGTRISLEPKEVEP